MEKIKTLQEVKEEHILNVLLHFDGNRSATARAIGMTVRNLRTILKGMKEAGEEVPESPYSLTRHK